MRNERYPMIRFADFTDSWKARKVGEFLSESRIQGTNGKRAKKLTVKLWRKGVVAKEEVFQGSEATQYYIRKKGQFIYGKLDFLNQAFGIIPAELDGYESTLDSPAYDICNELNENFLLEYVSRKQFYLHNGTIADGSRKAKRIHTDTFFNMSIMIPTLVEQNQIADLFRKMDRRIELQEDLLINLKQMKQGFLQKMFPKEGESVPEIRFPGFTDEWEQRKLGEVYRNIRNAFVGTATPYYVESEEDGYFYLESNNIKEGQINRNAEVFINEAFYQGQRDKWLHTGDLVMVQSGHVGHTAVIPKELDCVAAHALIMFQNSIDNINPYFTNYQLQTLESKKKLDYITTGNTIKHILASEMKQFTVDFSATIEEQTAISNFFLTLDDAITLHKQELDFLKQTKKAFLQKMFI